MSCEYVTLGQTISNQKEHTTKHTQHTTLLSNMSSHRHLHNPEKYVSGKRFVASSVLQNPTFNKGEQQNSELQKLLYYIITFFVTFRDLSHFTPPNAGTAFTDTEREKYGLRGLLPPKVETLEQQLNRALRQVWKNSFSCH